MTERIQRPILLRNRSQVVAALVLLSACSPLSSQQLPQGIDPAKRDWYGEFYNLAEYEKCVAKTNDVRNTQCEYLRLTRVEEPEYWPFPEVPKPKLPEPPNPPVYQPGMTSEQYFKALCEKEAGEFIYKTVDNVEGIYQIRPRKPASWDALFDRYVMEDPYGYTRWEAEDPATIFVSSPYQNYRYLETPVVRGGKGTQSFQRHSGYQYDGAQQKVKSPMRAEVVENIASRYAFTWRGIARPHDRELGIAGGELIVVDLKSGEVLGIRRGFARSGFVRNSRSGIQWETAAVCPQLRRQPDGWDKDGGFAVWYISKVLRPPARND